MSAGEGEKKGGPALSVCIVSWNTKSLLRDCLCSLFADPQSGQWEVLVVDNTSQDGSPAMVAGEFPQVQLIASDENLGFSRGNNLALERASGRHLLLLNPDTRVEPGALGQLVDYLDSHAEVGAVGPRLTDSRGRLELSCGRRPSLAAEIVHKLLLHRLLTFFRFGRWHHRERRSVGWVTGACLMVRGQAAEQTGFLDPRMYMCFEDLEWCMRLRRQGWQIVYCPDSRVTHLGGQSIRQNLGDMLVISQQSLFYLFNKHFGGGQLQVLRLFTVAEMVLRSALWGIGYRLAPSRREERQQRLRAYGQILRRSVADRSYWAPADTAARPNTKVPHQGKEN